MDRTTTKCALAGVFLLALTGRAAAVTREVANVPAFRLSFGESVLNQLTYDTYRTPYDELATRPYNLLFAGIGRRTSPPGPARKEATRATWTRSSGTTAPPTWTTTPTRSKGP
jgi:hypothetical protein